MSLLCRWMIGKQDGPRVFWNGVDSLQSEGRKNLPIPRWFQDQLPKIPFEAQL